MFDPDKELRLRNRRLKAWLSRTRRHARQKVPAGTRWIAGLILIGFGFLGFLPILGFWMIPLGVMLFMLDAGPLARHLWRMVFPPTK